MMHTLRSVVRADRRFTDRILATARHLTARNMSRDEIPSSYRVLIPRSRRAPRRVPWKALGFLLVVAGVGYVTVAAVLQSIKRFP